MKFGLLIFGIALVICSLCTFVDGFFFSKILRVAFEEKDSKDAKKDIMFCLIFLSCIFILGVVSILIAV